MNTDLERIVTGLLEAMGAQVSGVERKEVAGQTIISVNTSAEGLIGNRGEVVQALDHLVKKIAEREASMKEAEEGAEPAGRALLDINGYQERRIKDLQAKALMLAERARSFQYDVELSPMSAYERLIVHSALQDTPNVKTESQGEGRNRRVVIKYSAE